MASKRVSPPKTRQRDNAKDGAGDREEIASIHELLNIVDLQERSRRNTLRFQGFPEHCEGRGPAKFLWDVIPEMLGLEFPSGLVVERCHRLAVARMGSNRPERIPITRFLNWEDKESVTNAAREKGEIRWNGNLIRIFQDYSKETVSLRQSVENARGRRKAFKLKYPAVLCIATGGGGERRFESARTALSFISALQPVAEPPPDGALYRGGPGLDVGQIGR
ncbi:uncharacterized protein LOC119266020 [Pygocentrus nattereri]|uniref:uncharacterized protein LOC119266020 n=1 Tax=Pygocentrus nattereri TaxID=42514 RepID=UPI00189161F4|nr:uncharacterized protein LOC119266020 [Pygocentrus nattereri]XP_037403389.1 uncharacterized protein LOC119266020 [Pygocentrus nattereri]